jgi:hypothetical protein
MFLQINYQDATLHYNKNHDKILFDKNQIDIYLSPVGGKLFGVYVGQLLKNGDRSELGAIVLRPPINKTSDF